MNGIGQILNGIDITITDKRKLQDMADAIEEIRRACLHWKANGDGELVLNSSYPLN